jgi:hypothetical protein
MLSVLYGTIEYFEREMVDGVGVNRIMEDDLNLVYSRLESDLLYDFVCDERIREECLQNLTVAYENLKIKGLTIV